jgi:ComF family protein
MVFELLANILFPPVCVACRRRVVRGVICDACFKGVRYRFSVNSAPLHGEPYFLRAATNYDDKTVQALIHSLKFRSVSGAAEPLANLILHYVASLSAAESFAGFSGFTVIPIPLSARRRRARGYNQAELIARRVAEGLGLPIETNILIRAKHTTPQTETKSEAERNENIRGAFAVAEKMKSALTGRKILLIDDVATTGSTFREASLPLKSAGAQTIIAIAAAKT